MTSTRERMKLTKHRRCTLTAFGLHHMQSDGDPDKQYLVQINPSGEHVCTCINFVITRNKWKKNGKPGNYQCKHIQRALDKRTCDWSTENSEERHKYPTVCPRCHAPTEEYYETPTEISDADVEDAVTHMRAMLKEIRLRTDRT